MTNKITTQSTALSKGYMITAAQFVHENYADKIARGEVKVYLYHAPPAPDEVDAWKWYNITLAEHGNVDEIETVTCEEEYYVAHDKRQAPHLGIAHHGLGHGDCELLVWPAD